jgi:thiol:disulfide interchange protein
MLAGQWIGGMVMGRLCCLIALCGLLLTGGCSTDKPNAVGGNSSVPVATSASVSAVSPVAESGYDPKRNAAADVEAALKEAAGDKRAVLLDFGADWCPDCVVLQKLFQAEQVAPLLRQSYHVVSVDVGEFDRNLELAKKYVNLTKSGIPALVVLGSDGGIRVATNDGAFANARTMEAPEVAEFLSRWAR